MRNLAMPSRRARTSCSVIALATAMLVGPSPAAAQSLLGGGTFATNGGGVAGISTAPSTTTITVNPGQSVIDWTPTDNAIGGGNIAFQLSGTTATFTGASNFAVLNRINQADMNRAISLNGTINSLVNGQQGGSLYFYSAGGFLLGGSSIINVGSLVLSASPLTLDGSGNFINGTSVTFGQAPRATAGIVTSAGSTINANAGDAYVAMVAPRVQHGGSITVNGSAALVAAEAATINFSPSGLFDIQVTAGTTDTTGVSTSGTITGAASTGAGDTNRIYLVAVPKNSALTMLIGAGSNLGFDVAGAAEVVGNTVVLSAGHDIYAGGIGAPSSGTTGGALANIQVNDSNFSSAVIGDATGYVHLSAFNPMHFYSDATIHADGDIWFSTQAAAGTIDVTGNLNLSTERYAGFGQSLTTSAIDIYNVGGGGRITVNGSTNLNSVAHGGYSFVDNVPGGNATGGLIRVRANAGGAINLLGGLSANATAYAGSGSALGANGGNATGGMVRILTSGSNSALTITGGASLSSNAYGGSGNGGECFVCTGSGGNGQGGSIWVSSQNAPGSTLAITGDLEAGASGFGGSASDAAATAGSGHGGDSSLYTGTGSSLSVTGNVLLRAEGTGGTNSGGNAGAGTGGNAIISEAAGATSGTLVINGNAELSTDGHGGTSYGSGGLGGIGSGGTGGSNAYIYADNASITVNGGANVHANGYGGDAGYGTGGDATGGAAYIQSRNAIAISGAVSLGADAYGGNGAVGGDANGGDVFLIADSGGSLNLTGDVYNSLTASASAGDSNNGNGGIASGGSISAYAVNSSSTLTIAGSLSAYAEAYGGFGQGPGTGGDGVGGDVSIYTNSNGTLAVAQSLYVSTDAYGGDGTDGGLGQGGVISISSQSALTVGGYVYALARGFGGDIGNRFTQGQGAGLIGNVAGDGFGGDVDIYAQNGTLTLGAPVTMDANGRGGSASVSGDTAGNGNGGQSRLFANVGGTVNLSSSLYSSAIGQGGYQEGNDVIGGNGVGGAVRVQATGANAHITVNGSAGLNASGQASLPGGECYSCGGLGGNGTGGSVWVDAFGAATASLTFGASLEMVANGYGGDGKRAVGGNGQGGEVLLQATAGAQVSVAGDAVLRTDAYGGSSDDYSYNFNGAAPVANGGSAVGGTSRIQTYPSLGAGGIISIDGSAYVYARGYGGDASGSNVGYGGDGTGGSAHVISTGGSITIGDPELGYGNLNMAATGSGGDASGGTGGNGYGGTFVALEAINGDITIFGYADLDAGGIGGGGLFGGDGFASGDISDPEPLNWTGGAHIFAKNGDILIGGGAFVYDNGTGGDGGSGNGSSGDYGGDGGNGVGGWATIHAENSALGASSINILSGFAEGSGTGLVEANAYGGRGGDAGNGSYGGYGSDGGYGTTGTNGTAGGNATAGGAGGHGGNATAGYAGITAAADNGHVTIDYASGSAIAVGGDGGNGGYGGYGGVGGNGGAGTAGAGGNGGNGGNGGDGGVGGAGGSASGGGVTIGTVSGNGQAFGLGLGTATFLSATLDASATGGNGGDGGGNGSGGSGGSGGFGTPLGLNGVSGANGAAGDGGDGGGATGGRATLLVRGSTVTVATATLSADATGGDAGFGYVGGFGANGFTGVGGDATVGGDGGISVLVTGRYLNPTQRGTLNAGDISGTAIATAGIGIPNGDVASLGGSGVTFLNADGTIDSLDFQVGVGSNSFNTIISGLDSISVINGGVTVNNDFSFITDGNLSLFANNGDMHAGALTLSAGNYVFDPVNDPPSNRGTYFADSAAITTGNNFVTTANLDIGSSLIIDAPGLINAHDFTIDGDLDLLAHGGNLTTNNLNVTGAINLDAFGAIYLNIVQAGFFHADAGTFFTSDDITSDSNIQIFAGDDVTVGDLGAGATADINSNKAIRIDTDGSVLVGNILAAGGIDITADGSVTGGNVTTGDGVFTDAGGAIHYGNISAGLVNPQPPSEPFSVGMNSATSITVGDVDASQGVGFLTSGTLTTGNIMTGSDLLALVHGNISIGDIDADGRVYLADPSSFTDAGGNIGNGGDNNVDPELIFAATPVATGGSITINGPVTSGAFYAAAGTFFDAGDITSDRSIHVNAGTDITVGDLVAGLSDDVIDSHAIRLNAGGSIDLGNAIADGRIKFEAIGTINGGDITSGDMVDAEADGAIVLGDISSGLVNPQPPTAGDVSVGIKSKTSIQVGNIDSAGTVGLVTLGTLNTGDIDASGDLIALAGGNMMLGNVDIGGRAMLSNPSLYIDAQDINGDVSADDILNAAIAPSGGSITTGTINAASVQASAGTTLTVGTIIASGKVDLSSGGAMQTQNITSGDSLRLTSGGSITGGNYIANTLVRVFGAGAVNIGNITIVHPQNAAEVIDGVIFDVGTGAPVEVFGGSISTGNIRTDGYVGLYTPGTLAVGTINATHDVIALAGGNASFGAITTTERFLLGGYSMFAGLGAGPAFNPALAFGLTKTKTDGSATFGGASSANSFQAYVGGAVTLQSLTTSSSALIDALGLFTLNGTLNGNSRIISNDIDIGANGAVNTGTLQLVSRNATQTVVGDGVAGDGYQLSDAEFDRIHTPLSVVADVSYGAAAKMLIGDLTATVSGASLSGYDYLFATINGNSSTSVGSIKVLGDVTFTGLSLTDEVAFQTNLFELDAATGSVNLFGSGTTLGGVLGLYAPKVWVASGDILAKLEVDPRYSGYIAELNAPAAVQRPEGVLRAASIDIDAGSEAIQSLLVQNTGTRAIPAGFLLTDVNIDSSEAPEAAPGSIDLVINGQIISQGITYTGIAVRDGLVAEFGIIPFTSTSTINGCPLTGSCSGAPRINILQPTDFQLVNNGGLGDGLFGNEPDIDDGLNGDDGDLSSPIEPPVPLFDSRPLDPSEDINDPASGAGNPSLYGSSDEDDEDDKRKKAKKAKKGDGK